VKERRVEAPLDAPILLFSNSKRKYFFYLQIQLMQFIRKARAGKPRNSAATSNNSGTVMQFGCGTRILRVVSPA